MHVFLLTTHSSTPIQLIALMPISPLYVPEAGNLPGYTPSDVLNDDTFYYNGIIHRDNSKYEVTTMRYHRIFLYPSFIGFQLMEGYGVAF